MHITVAGEFGDESPMIQCSKVASKVPCKMQEMVRSELRGTHSHKELTTDETAQGLF